MTRKQLLNLLERNEIEQVLEGLKPQITQNNEELLQKHAVVSARFYNNRDLELNDTEGRGEIRQEYNRIREALFQLIEQTFSPDRPSNSKARAMLIKWRLPLIVLGISLLLLGIGMIPEKQTRFEATVKTSLVTLHLPAGWPKNHYFPIIYASFYGVEEVKDEKARLWSREFGEGEPSIILDSGRAILQDLVPGDRPTLTLSVTDGVVQLSFKEEETRGVIDASQGRLILPDRTANSGFVQWTIGPGGSISFKPSNAQNFDVVQRLEFDLIEFLEHANDQVISTIQSGTIRIKGKKDADSTKLQAKDFLVLQDISQADASIRLLDESNLEVKLQGRARVIRSGLHSPLASLKPTLLEKFYNDQRVMFFLLAFSNLIGLLWTVARALGLGGKD